MNKRDYSMTPDKRQARRWKRGTMLRAMRAYFTDPVREKEWWDNVTAAQEELRREGNPRAYDLLAVAKRSLAMSLAILRDGGR